MLEANSLYGGWNQLLCHPIGSHAKILSFCARIFASWLQFIFSFCDAVVCFNFLCSSCHIHVGHSFIFATGHILPIETTFSSLFIIEIIFNCEIFQAISACYSDACAFPCFDFCQGEIQVRACYANQFYFARINMQFKCAPTYECVSNAQTITSMWNIFMFIYDYLCQRLYKKYNNSQ